jgi:DNA-binding transcriptional LysR family regulator
MDQKLHTFLTLCQTMNYRLAAEHLHLSQPAVTKQIQSLEQMLQTKLFHYDGHSLHKTEECLLLERYAISQQYQFEELQLALADKKRLKLRIGATKTIGDYVLIDAIKDFLGDPAHELSLVVDNTKHLLQMLDENQLDFAVIEGTFSKTKYDSYLMRMEPFVGICAKSSPLCGKQVSIEDLLSQTIIVREEGSGTRRIFEERLIAAGYELSDFYREVSISSFVSIKALVAGGIGVSFLYKSVVENEHNIGTFTVNGITEPHAFHVVYTRNTNARHYAKKFLGNVVE